MSPANRVTRDLVMMQEQHRQELQVPVSQGKRLQYLIMPIDVLCLLDEGCQPALHSAQPKQVHVVSLFSLFPHVLTRVAQDLS